jgi:single-strand DNA-binding protein
MAMAKGLNKVQIIGNLGRDPEMKYTPGGQAVTQFSIAVARNSKKDGEQTDWFRFVCWDKLAELVDQHLKKGNRVYVEGRLQVRKYTGRDGVEKSVTEIVCHDLIMLSGHDEKQEPTPVAAGSAKRRAPSADTFDDVPF